MIFLKKKNEKEIECSWNIEQQNMHWVPSKLSLEK